MEKESFAPRLHAIFARDANTAIVFRRGPSKRVGLFRWNLKDNSFEEGQWLKGRIYERRSDLSPDGQYLIYFAMNGRWKSETGGSWTAISKPPWLKAISLFRKGDCWEGGGLFLDCRKFWLNDRYYSGKRAMRMSSEVELSTDFPLDQYYGSEDTGIYYPRLIRDGWNLLEWRSRVDNAHDITVFEKPLQRGWKLRKIAHAQVGPPEGRGCYWDEHILMNEKSGAEIAQPDWEWADARGSHVYFAQNGCIGTSQIKNMETFRSPSTLQDFSDFSFRAVAAPS